MTLNSPTPSLRPHYQASSLPRVGPPLRLASVLCPLRFFRLGFSLRIEATGSHVPHESLSRARAAFMPVIARAVNRCLPNFIPGQRLEPGFDDVPTLSTRRQRFTHVRLPDSYLTGSSPAFSWNAHHPSHWTRAASGGLGPGPAARSRGADPYLSCSKATFRRPFCRPPVRAVVAHSRPRTARDTPRPAGEA